MWVAANSTVCNATTALAAVNLEQSLGILQEWTQALQAVTPHWQDSDGATGMAHLAPVLRESDHEVLAEKMAGGEGLGTWLNLDYVTRSALSLSLADRLSASALFDIQNEARSLLQSVGRTRSVDLAVFGRLQDGRPEIPAVMNRLFPYGMGRGLILEAPRIGRSVASHRIYFYKQDLSPDDTVPYIPNGFHSISMTDPLKIGMMSVGALSAAQVEGAIRSDTSIETPVNILLISGVLMNDWKLYERVVEYFNANIIFMKNPDETRSTHIEQIDSTLMVILGAARYTHSLVTFDPRRHAFDLNLIQSPGVRS